MFLKKVGKGLAPFRHNFKQVFGYRTSVAKRKKPNFSSELFWQPINPKFTHSFRAFHIVPIRKYLLGPYFDLAVHLLKFFLFLRFHELGFCLNFLLFL